MQEERYNYWQELALQPLKDFTLPSPKTNFGSWGSYETQLDILEIILLKEWQAYQSFSKEEQKEFINEMKELSEKLKILKVAKENLTTKETSEDEIHILFARTPGGNIMLEKDLKNLKGIIEKSTYQDYIDLLKKLKTDPQDFNEQKQKPLTEDKKLKGIYELKDFQARLYYRYVEGYIVVLGAHQKKDDWSKEDQNFVTNMNKQSKQFLENLKKKLKDKDDKVLEDIITENDEIYEQLIQEKNNPNHKKLIKKL